MADRRFVVKENIPVAGVWAYTRGQVITDADAIERNGWQDYVVGEDTKEAREIKADITGRDVSDFDTKTSAPAKPAANREG
ncbi:MAG TPA: hypothetical protein VHK64_04785 [Nocardioidaceae bacterium]|nr:hypothetical protein [Nocardioidaceae bacterium]